MSDIRFQTLLRTAALAAPWLLAACGGGGGSEVVPPPNAAPSIVAFSADRGDYFVGDTATLTVRYSGGAGRIEPGVGPVADGARIQTPTLDADRVYRLVVEGPQGAAVRELRLPVRYRDRYVEVPGSLQSVGHEAIALEDGAVLLIGGSRGEGVLSHRITRFDPRLRTLDDIGRLQVGRTDHRVTRLASGDILVTGGETSLQLPRLIELVDPRTGVSQAAGELAVKRSAHTATRLADGRVLITGGYASGARGVHDSAELWDPATRRAIQLPAKMVSPRAAHTATLLADGRVLIVGGYALPDATYAAAELFDPRTETFSPVPSADASKRFLHAAQTQPDGSVLILGGEDFDHVTEVTTPRSDITRFDPVSGRIEAVGNLLAPRSAVRLDGAHGRALLFGGLGASDARVAGAESFGLKDGAKPLAAMPGQRAWHTVTRLADGRILIAGGEDGARSFVPSVLLYE